eukprot:TRINITY_DN45729_c0_g1_i1.p1 TRINITY_DN45729_c0_g1~~TRINITY_DN45729_c0_g1_i1.p1  ORF type:complete len:435 (+),score=68.57 TRINITY_DN45729_c0_g1_i1:25-1305(+)
MADALYEAAVCRPSEHLGQLAGLQPRPHTDALPEAVLCGTPGRIQKLLAEAIALGDPLLGRYRKSLLFTVAGRPQSLGDSEEVCELLVKSLGAEWDEPCGRLSQTPLFLATAQGARDVVQFLLGLRAAVNRKDAKSESPLAHAARLGHESCLGLLLDAKARVCQRGDRDLVPLHYAAMEGHLACVLRLLEARADATVRDATGRTPLFVARGKTGECTSALLSSTGDRNFSNRMNVLELCNEDLQTPIFDAASRGDVAKASLLLCARADVDARDVHQQTPLFFAAAAGHLPLCRLLVDEGKATLGARDKFGRWPCALADEQGHATVTAFLNAASSQTHDNIGAPERCQPLSQLERRRSDRTDPEEEDSRRRKRFRIMFLIDPQQPAEEANFVPFDSRQYEEALQKLVESCPGCENCPWFQNVRLSER